MFNSLDHKRNANENSIEILPHQQVLVRMLEKRNSYTLLVEM
jgi:uncharacterized membrane protein YecN with MAPEG domain